jgi:signal transduction histidine kinase
MLNSDQDLDINSNPQARSHGQSLSSEASLRYSPIYSESSIEQSPAVPIFAEATALVMRLTDAPVAILTAIAGSGYQIGSISGLERFTAMPTHPNLLLELAGLEYCHDRPTGSERSLNITDLQHHPQLSQSPLFRVHGVRSYLGLPIVTAARDRLGTLAILDFKPRQFSDRDLDLLQLVSRFVASEFERKLLSQSQLNREIGNLRYRGILGFDDPSAAIEHGNDLAAMQFTPFSIERSAEEELLSLVDLDKTAPVEKNLPSAYSQNRSEIHSKLLTHLAQELRTPLTSVLGMASVLQQEIYGTLTAKQKDYLGIIHHSGQKLVAIVDEISQLGGFVSVDDSLDKQNEHRQHSQLTWRSVDLEMLCQLAIQSLEPLAQKKQQQIILDLPNSHLSATKLAQKLCLLDRDLVRQIVYYLCLSLIHTSAVASQISIRLANLDDVLQIQIATNDPHALRLDAAVQGELQIPDLGESDRSHPLASNIGQDLHISLGLSLSQTLAASHGGKIESIGDRCGYQVTLPAIDVTPEN